MIFDFDYVIIIIRVVSLGVAYNGLALGAVADFGARNCQYTTKVDTR
jgi:hypothetical protein